MLSMTEASSPWMSGFRYSIDLLFIVLSKLVNTYSVGVYL